MPAPPGEPSPIAGEGYELVFVDDFEGTSLNGDIWRPPPAHGVDFPAGAISVANSILTVTADLNSPIRDYVEVWSLGPRRPDYPNYPNYPNALAWQEGYFEVRCRVTNDPWTKLALWFFSLEDKNAWATPNRDCSRLSAEWDMIENGIRASVATDGYADVNHVMNAHRNTVDRCDVPDSTRRYVVTGLTGLTDWHTWGGKWTGSQVSTYLDGTLMGTAATYDTFAQAMPFIMSAAPIPSTPFGSPPRPDFIVLDVDYFQVWQQPTNARRSTLQLPGVSGSYVSSPDDPSLHINGDMAVLVDVSMDDWSPASFQRFVSRYAGGAASNHPFSFAITSLGLPRWTWSDGTTERTLNASTAVPGSPVNGERRYIAAEIDVDDGAGGHGVRFYTSDDWVNWTQLGSVRSAGAFTTSIVSGTAPLEIGSRNEGTVELMPGQIHRVEIRSGSVTGPIVARADFTDKTPGMTSFTDETGKTYTVNGTAAIRPGTPKPDIYTPASPLRLG